MSKTLRWMAQYSALEIILYNLLLTAHQIAIAPVLGCTGFGVIGILFGIIYMSIACALAGLYQQLIQVDRLQHSLTNILGVQIAMIAVVIAGTVGAMYLMNYQLHVIALVAFVVLTENGHKTAKLLLYREQQHNIIAFVEFATLALYIMLVWGCYATVGYINPLITLGNFALVGCCINILYWILVTKNLNKISYVRASNNNQNTLVSCLWQRLTFAGMNITLTSVNSNSITVVLGRIFGPTSIIYLKLARQYTDMITNLVDHIAGINVGILLHKEPIESLYKKYIRRFAAIAAGCSILLVATALGLVSMRCNVSLVQEIVPAVALVAIIALDQYITPFIHAAYVNNQWQRFMLIPGLQLTTGFSLYWTGASFMTLIIGIAVAKLLGIAIVLYSQNLLIIKNKKK